MNFSNNDPITTPTSKAMGYEFYKPFSRQSSQILDCVLKTIENQAEIFLTREFTKNTDYRPETAEQRITREAMYWEKAVACKDCKFTRWLVFLNQLDFIDWSEIPRWKIDGYPNIKLVISLAAEVANRTIQSDESHEEMSGSGVGKRSFKEIVHATSARCWVNRLFKICLAWGFVWDDTTKDFSWPSDSNSK